jgi:regulator of CtrA degradation
MTESSSNTPKVIQISERVHLKKPVSEIEIRSPGIRGMNPAFADCSALVERAAKYLDGPGREIAKKLRGSESVAYATESMRLTTRLIELAAWMMTERDRQEGKPVDETRLAEIRRNLSIPIVRGLRAKTLPDGLANLIAEAQAMQKRILRLDPVLSQLG